MVRGAAAGHRGLGSGEGAVWPSGTSPASNPGARCSSDLDTQDVKPDAGASFTAADHDHDPLDAVAGSEYLDDRIRFQE